VICSITLLTKKKFFWIGGVLIGVYGIGWQRQVFFLH